MGGRMQAAVMCNILGRVLANDEWIQRLKVIDTAQVPVIKLSAMPGALDERGRPVELKKQQEGEDGHNKKDGTADSNPGVDSGGTFNAARGDDSLLDVDLTFALPSHAGLSVVQYVRSLLSKHAPLGPMVLVIKTFLAGKGLSDPYTGGLSSYGL